MQHSESPNFFDILAYVDFNNDLINNKRKRNIALTSKPSGTVNQTKPANFAQNSMRVVLKYSAILTDHKNRRNPTIETRNCYFC